MNEHDTIRAMLAKRYHGAIEVTDEMIDAVVRELPPKLAIPSQISGRAVVAFVPVIAYLDNGTPTHSGAVARVVCEEHPNDYVVWTLYGDNGEWVTGNGHYNLTYTEALTVLAKRVIGAGMDDRGGSL